MLKSSVELRGTVESGDNSLWVLHYKRFISRYKIIWVKAQSKSKSIINAALSDLLKTDLKGSLGAVFRKMSFANIFLIKMSKFKEP